MVTAVGPASRYSRPLERRGSPRHRTVYRLVKVDHDGEVSISHVCNISDEGVMLSINDDIDVGEKLSIEFTEAHRLSGRVVWVDEGHCGVALDKPIDSAALLRDLAAEQRSPAHRALRVEATLLGVAYSELGMHPVRTTNLSQKGMGLSHDGRFQPGLRLLVLLENGIERHGVVRWTQELHAGVQLIEPLACSDLNRCIDGERTAHC